ncbi:MAG: squalene--hopene cyclase [Desulfovibrionaceae bacterium]|nr:squalene--hopene cyclase [Desulfovibrionaceae bacterium]
MSKRLPFTLKALAQAADRALAWLTGRQDREGFWVFDLEADATIPAEYLLYRRFMGWDPDPGLVARLAEYLRRKQLPDGGWPLYDGDGKADVSASVKAYWALKLCGDRPEAAHMVRARQMILSLGGAAKSNVFTRFTLCLFGQMPWRLCPAMPIETVLLPRWFFFHFSKVSYWSRVVVVPLLLIYAHRPVCRLRLEEAVQELFVTPPDRIRHLDRFGQRGLLKDLFIALDRVLKVVEPYFPKGLRNRAVARAEAWLRSRMRGVGGNGAVFPSMVNAVEALRVLGAPDSDPDLVRGSAALDDLLLDRGEVSFCQPCVSPVWDTCLCLSAILEAGIDPGHPAVSRAVDWLFSKQVFFRGDWADYSPGLEAGGWAFQFENDFYPDLDDTAMVVMALLRAGCLDNERHRGLLAKAVNWMLGMQSSDGGWGAFDVDNDALFLNQIPFADHGALLDPSTSDLTARCVETLAMLGYGRDFAPLARGLEFLRREQEDCGAWFGRWGCNYIYGTWSVLSALRMAGEDMSAPWVRRAVDWFKSVQNPDGGFGETLYSYDDPSLAGKGASTRSQTAWALLGLLAAGEVDDPAVQRGVKHLLDTQDEHGDWDEVHFTGTGFPRVFYLRYHGYCRYFPLWALGMYQRLRRGGPTVQWEKALSEPAWPLLPAARS